MPGQAVGAGNAPAGQCPGFVGRAQEMWWCMAATLVAQVYGIPTTPGAPSVVSAECLSHCLISGNGVYLNHRGCARLQKGTVLPEFFPSKCGDRCVGFFGVVMGGNQRHGPYLKNRKSPELSTLQQT
jgi:hypothetical protein